MTIELAKPKPKRRWFQFRLSSLFVLVTVAAVALAMWRLASERRDVRIRKEAVQAIKECGCAIVGYDHKPPGPAWRRILLGDDADIDVLEVTFRGEVTDDDLAHLASLTNLKRLDVEPEISECQRLSPRITDAGLVPLCNLKKLERLALVDTQITDAGLGHLASLTNLKYLELYDTRVTDAGMVHVGGLSNLETLSLNGTLVTDAGMVELTMLRNLKELRIENSRISDAGGLTLLNALPRLRQGGKITFTNWCG